MNIKKMVVGFALGITLALGMLIMAPGSAEADRLWWCPYGYYFTCPDPVFFNGVRHCNTSATCTSTTYTCYYSPC